jgi:hypothetical protein
MRGKMRDTRVPACVSRAARVNRWSRKGCARDELFVLHLPGLSPAPSRWPYDHDIGIGIPRATPTPPEGQITLPPYRIRLQGG